MPISPMSENGNVSIEHVPAGIGIPDWLTDNLCQLFNSGEDKSNPRLMVIHAGDASRAQSIKGVDEKVSGGLDPTLFQTVDSLVDALHVDLHLPRILNDDGVTNLLVHLSCEKSAADLGFPLVHPIPEKTWPYSKTSRLMQLFGALAEEEDNYSWDNDPGVAEFERVLKMVERDVDGVHPLRQLKEIVNTLNEWADRGEKPFTLVNLDGIVLLDQPPSLSWLRREFLIAVSRFIPLHQVSHAGKFRLGEHGAWLRDIPDVSRPDETLKDVFAFDERKPWQAPSQLPWHMSVEGRGKSTVHRINLGRASHDLDAVLCLIDAFEEGGGGSVLISDAALARRRSKWHEALRERAHVISEGPKSLRTNPAIHWVLALAKLPHGEDAWSMQSIRSLAVQKTLPFIDGWLSGGQHPSEPMAQARAHPGILEDIARSYHILGGPGALSRWLHALGNWRPDPLMIGYQKTMLSLEETQWWMRNLIELLRPLLTEEDKLAVDEFGEICGALYHGDLPIINSVESGDEWLQSLLRVVDWNMIVDRTDGSVTGMQQLMELTNRCKVMLDAAGHVRKTTGLGWVEELELMISDSVISSKREVGELQLLTPAASLGCRADLVVVCGLSSTDWSMRNPTIPWLDDETKLELRILRPDAPLCDARHHLRHLLNSGTTVVVLDPTEDSDSQPCAPLSEWLANMTTEEKQNLSIAPHFVREEEWNEKDPARLWDMIYDEKFSNSYLTPRPAAVAITPEGVRSDVNGPRLRHWRQNSGLAMREGRDSIVGSLHPDSIAIGWSEQMMYDRFKREPEVPDVHDLWVNITEHDRLVSMERQKLDPGKRWPKKRIKLRESELWPALTGRPSPRTIIPTVDPRPLRPTSTGILTYDHLHGEDSALSLGEVVWSASRLNSWLECPRKGWLEKHLRATAEEDLREDLDARTRGTLYHDSIAKLICEKLGFQIGDVRTDFEIPNLAQSGISDNLLMADLVGLVIESAPWLTRGDAVAAQRRHELLAMGADGVEGFISSPVPLELEGSIGRLLSAELLLSETCVIALEAPLKQTGDEYVTLSVPSSPDDSERSGEIGSLNVRGRIDRVEVLWNRESNGWENDEGEKGVCPLDLDIDEEWCAKRYVIIRDLKTVKGPVSGDRGKRHRGALFKEVQLALYARAWELMNPGDRVVGVGITEAGETVEHYVELDSTVNGLVNSERLGTITNFSQNLYRRPGESHNPKSNPFRAWLRQKLSVAVLASEAACNGETRPTPSKSSCEYCRVKEICGLGNMLGGGA